MFTNGWTIDEIQTDLPTLSATQIHDAISYGYDHLEETDEWRARRKLREVLRRHDLVYVDGRLIPRTAFRDSDAPPGSTAYTWDTLPDALNDE